MSQLIKTITKANARAASVLIRKYVPIHFPPWAEKRRAIANELARCALIRCGDGRKPRIYFENEQLFMLGEGALFYTGEELRTQDEDIWLTLSHRARNLPSEKMTIRISNSEICLQNKWRQDQRYYTAIFKSMQRMKGGVITIISRRLAKALKCQAALDRNASEEELAALYEELQAFDEQKESGLSAEKDEKTAGMLLSLISGEPVFTNATKVIDGIPQGNLHWEITLDKKLVALFAQPYLTLVDFETRTKLSSKGKRLQTYFSSHKNPYGVLLRSLEQMLGMAFGNGAALKYALTIEFEALKDAGVIENYTYEKSKDGKDWLVTVIRPPYTTQND